MSLDIKHQMQSRAEPAGMLSPVRTGRSSLPARREQQTLNLRDVRAFPQLLRHRSCPAMAQHTRQGRPRSAALVCMCCVVLSAVAPPAAATAPQPGSTARLWPHLSAGRSGCSSEAAVQPSSEPADKPHWPTEVERRATAADVLAVLSGEHLCDAKWVSLAARLCKHVWLCSCAVLGRNLE